MYFINMFTHKTLILASSSKSRSKILKNSGVVFKQVKPRCDEEIIKAKIKQKNKPVNIAKILSYEKAKSISILKKYSNKYVLGCDTIICLENNIFDKAKNFEQAKSKLKKLSGKKHKIISAVSVCQKEKQIWSSKQETTITLKKLNNEQIDEYLKKTGKQILSSVGCYQAEKLGPLIIKSIKGDFFNVLGFPLFPFLSFLSNREK